LKHHAYRSLLSAYLDGEIGLEDKRELEEALRNDPQLRAEYHELRQLGLALGRSLPEVRVHPFRFRQQLANTLDNRSGGLLTPQRAFMAAMALSLVAVSITFGLFIYQQRVVGQGAFLTMTEAQLPRPQIAPRPQFSATLVIETTPELFYNRLMVETQLGMLDPSIASRLLLQTSALEGATCREGLGLNQIVFPQRLPTRAAARLSLADLQRLQMVADGLTARPNALAISSSDGRLTTQQDYLLSFPSGAELPVELIFQQ
jgi:hypothetical protein